MKARSFRAGVCIAIALSTLPAWAQKQESQRPSSCAEPLRNENRPVLQLAGAGGGGAHGGVGLMVNGSLYLLDLVEGGVETNPFFDPDVRINPDLQKEVDLALANLQLKPKVRELVAYKLTELERISRVFALQLLMGMKSYSWRMVSSVLMPTYDERTALRRCPGDRFQLAARTERTIMLSRQDTALLDDANLAATIYHEMFFAYSKVQQFCDPPLSSPLTPDQRCNLRSVQVSSSAQATTGHVFSGDLKRQGLEGLKRIMGGNIDLTLDDTSVGPYSWGTGLANIQHLSAKPGVAITIGSRTEHAFLFAPPEEVAQSVCKSWGVPRDPDRLVGTSMSVEGRELSVRFGDYTNIDGPHSRLYASWATSNTTVRSASLRLQTGTVEECHAKVAAAFGGIAAFVRENYIQ